MATTPATAKESDSFTHRWEALAFPIGEVRGEPVPDFTDDLNDLVNTLFADTLEELNQENRRLNRDCRDPAAQRRLYHRVRNALGGPVVFTRNRLRPAINSHPKNFKIPLPRSIYRDFPPWRSISLGLLSKFGDKMAEMVRFDLEEELVATGGEVAPRGAVWSVSGPAGDEVARFAAADRRPATAAGRAYYRLANGQAVVTEDGRVTLVTPILVGSDKFSHFFFRGHLLYRRLAGGEPGRLEELLDYNYGLEVSLWGSKSTGVAAYGDLVANFQGLRFYIRLRGESFDGRPMSDPLGADTGFVDCDGGAVWRQTRPIDLRDYLDPAWDEAHNCNLVRSNGLLAMVERRLDDLAAGDSEHRYRCPVDRELIERTAERYGRFAPRLINADGLRSLAAEADPAPPVALSAGIGGSHQQRATGNPER